MKKNFDDCLNLIQSEKIRKFVEKALAEADPKFWTYPCSSSGKYHPPEDNFDGGVIIHTRKAVQVAVSLFRFFDVQNQLWKDKIIAAVILHDICKNGFPWGEKTDYEHGLIAAKWLIEIGKLEKNGAKDDFIHLDLDIGHIIELVRNHMAVWNKPYPTPALETTKTLRFMNIAHLIVQISDYWASRKWCPFVCDKISVEDISS